MAKFMTHFSIKGISHNGYKISIHHFCITICISVFYPLGWGRGVYVPLNRVQFSPFWLWKRVWKSPGGRVLPYITYVGMCRPTGSWFWSSWFRMGYPFHRRFVERGIIFRTHESSSFVSSHLKLFKDRLLLKTWFNALTSKLLYSLQLRTEYKKLAHF